MTLNAHQREQCIELLNLDLEMNKLAEKRADLVEKIRGVFNYHGVSVIRTLHKGGVGVIHEHDRMIQTELLSLDT